MMTPQQRQMARHALGLPNDRGVSYRNRYFPAKGGDAESVWKDLVKSGLANRDSLCFFLTRAGAEEALMIGEKLDREDFPTAYLPE